MRRTAGGWKGCQGFSGFFAGDHRGSVVAAVGTNGGVLIDLDLGDIDDLRVFGLIRGIRMISRWRRSEADLSKVLEPQNEGILDVREFDEVG